jgi:hypothetical protein
MVTATICEKLKNEPFRTQYQHQKTKIKIVTNCHEILKALIWTGHICGHAIIQDVKCWLFDHGALDSVVGDFILRTTEGHFLSFLGFHLLINIHPLLNTHLSMPP